MKIQGVASGFEAEVSRPPARLASVKDETEKGRPEAPAVSQPPPAAAPPVAVREEPSAKSGSRELERLAAEIQKYIKESRSVVDFSLDEDLKTLVMKVLDAESGKVIRQFPPEEVLAVMKHLREQRGIFLDKKG